MLSTSPKDINLILEHFYTNIYGPKPINAAAGKAFLEQAPLPQVDQILLAQLNTPVIVRHVLSAITNLANRKAPGPDGYASKFYKLSATTIALTLVSVYQSILDGGQY